MVVQRIVLATAAVGLVAFASASSTAIVAQEESAESEACCFTNPAYSGVCKVVPAEGETCESILAYLNNPMAQGKDYCGGTLVRQGWAQVDCEDADSQ
jgi:hypothetical protein